MMERTLVLLKPCTLQRGLVGEIISIFEKKGLHLCGMKMMQLERALCTLGAASIFSARQKLYGGRTYYRHVLRGR